VRYRRWHIFARVTAAMGEWSPFDGRGGFMGELVASRDPSCLWIEHDQQK